MRGLARILCAAFALCLVSCALAEEIYFMGPQDDFYHLDGECRMMDGDMYSVSLDAAEEFRKTACPACAEEVVFDAQKAGPVTVVKAEGPEYAEVYIENTLFEREIDGVRYFILTNGDVEDSKVRVMRGADSKEFFLWGISENTNEDVVAIDRNNGEEEFSASDIFGLRLCKYSTSANENLVDAQVCLFPEDGEFFGETQYGLEMDCTGYKDRGIAHYWLLTREEFARMGSVTIEGDGRKFTGDVYFDPFFTGDDAPEARDGVEGWQLGGGASVKEKYNDTSRLEKEDDFCGLYLGSSGHYVVAVKNPTKKRARQYAKLAGGDIWVVQGEYTMKEMEKAREGAEEIVGADFASSSINPVTNRVEIEVCGAGINAYADGELFESCVEVTYDGELVWERGELAAADEEISRAPISYAEISGVSAYMEREEYPVGAEYISFCVDVEDEYCAVTLSGVLEKYADGRWQRVAGNYVFTSFSGLRNVFERPRTILTPGTWSFRISAEEYEKMGEGLYRLTALRIGEEEAVIEFTVTDDAAPMEAYGEKRPPNSAPEPGAHMPAHSMPGYNSLSDDFDTFTAGGWVFSLMWLPEETWETYENRVTAVLAWPEDDPEAVQKIYEAEMDAFRMFDTGDGIVIMGIAQMIRMDYDGGNAEVIIRAKKGFKQALMLDDDIYYLAGNHLWRWSDGEPEKIWSPKKGVGEVLEFYNETLYATNAAGKTFEIDISK